ncbi:MAG: MarR family transcriptional regulator [Chloroflexota bacterium]|nr:MAG: MarR family transcriptional regulator [Chloroflexota bacterium]
MDARIDDPRRCSKHLFPLILRLSKRIMDDAAAQLRPWGVTPTQYGALCLLLERSLTASELGRLMLLTSTTMTGIIDRLERNGLVERGSNPEDRRQSPVMLTPRGSTLVKRLRLIPIEPEGQLEEGLAALPDAERKQLEQLIIRLMREMGDGEFVEAAEAMEVYIESMAPQPLP